MFAAHRRPTVKKSTGSELSRPDTQGSVHVLLWKLVNAMTERVCSHGHVRPGYINPSIKVSDHNSFYHNPKMASVSSTASTLRGPDVSAAVAHSRQSSTHNVMKRIIVLCDG